MAMIKIYHNTPSVYSDKSRDFQLIGHVFEAVFNSSKLAADMLDKMMPNNNFDERLLNLSTTTTGFIRKHEYNTLDLTMILSSFANLLRLKGTKSAIESALNILLRSQGISDRYAIEIDSENKLITLYLSERLEDLVLLTDLFDYILPFGFNYRIIQSRLTSVTGYLTDINYQDVRDGEDKVKIGALINEPIVNETFKTVIDHNLPETVDQRPIKNGEIKNVIYDPVTVTVYGNKVTTTYDGAPHDVSGVNFVAKLGEQVLSNADFTFSSDSVVYGLTETNAGTFTKHFALDDVSITSERYPNITMVSGDGDDLYIQLTIKRLPVTIRAASASKQYDGSPLTSSNFTVVGQPSTDTHSFIVSMTSGSTITNVGTRPNVISRVDGEAVTTGVETEIGNNYLVTTVDGTLRITQKVVFNYYKSLNSYPMYAGQSYTFTDAPTATLQPNTNYDLSIEVHGSSNGYIDTTVTTNDSGQLSLTRPTSSSIWVVTLVIGGTTNLILKSNTTSRLFNIRVNLFSREGVV